MENQIWDIPVAFYFQVKIGDSEYAFKEVSGLFPGMQTETTEGSKDFRQELPDPFMKHENLVLKRGLVPVLSKELTWIKDILEGEFSKRVAVKNIGISLLGSEGIPVYTWLLSNAYPVKWETGALGLSDSILIETLEFAYSAAHRVL